VTVSAPGHGRLIGIGSTWRYIPAPDFHGTDSVIVTARDAEHVTSATFTFNVAPVNDLPAPRPEGMATMEDEPVVIEAAKLVDNDRDLDGDLLTVVAVGNASRGTVTLADGMITFVPDADAHGAAGFRYTVSDGTATATADVTVEIGGINDAPVAASDQLRVDEDAAIAMSPTVLLDNDSDIDRDSLTVTEVGDPVGGEVEIIGDDIVFAPARNFAGTARFGYTISDGQASATGEVVIEVTPMNDAPLLMPTAASTTAGTEVEIAVPATDLDGDAWTTAIVGRPAHGTAVIRAGALFYQPAAGFSGTDQVVLQVSDGQALSTAEVVTILVE
jgi:hypothetical protein